MMKIASWNTEGRLSRYVEDGSRGSPEHIIESVEKLDSDVVFLPEAFDSRKGIEPQIKNRLNELGYSLVEIAYEQRGDRSLEAIADPYLLFLSRLQVCNVQQLRLGDIRNMMAVDVLDSELDQIFRIFCVHLDDRSEANRLRQIDDLIPHITASDLPVIAMGDFNAMPRDTLPAALLRSKIAFKAIDLLPHPQIKDLLKRLSEMAIGNTLQELQIATGLIRADPKNRLTTTPKMRGQEWMPSIRLAKIDHIFISPEIKVSNFCVARDSGSDHRAISATIKV